MAFEQLLKDHARVVILASGNKSKVEEYQRLCAAENTRFLSIKEFAEQTGIPIADLDSPENEQDYAQIAKGKVSKIQTAVAHYRPDLITADNVYLLGDDYGAAAQALTFQYVPALQTQTMDNEFAIQVDADQNIQSITTSRPFLHGQDAPGYFSHRIIKAYAKLRKLDDSQPDFKKRAFELFATQLIRLAQEKKNFTSTATVAVSFAKGFNNSPEVIQQSGYYPLIQSDELIHATGFDFDRIQQISAENHATIASLSHQEKDQLFVRGQAVHLALNQLFTPLSKEVSMPSEQEKKIMELNAISPIDGRYRAITEPLSSFFSEKALMKYRLKVMVAWFIQLGNAGIEQYRALREDEINYLNTLVESFNDEDALRIKEIEKTADHDVKAIEYFLKEKIEQSSCANLQANEEFVHFECTSEDVNNIAYALMIKEARAQILLPAMDVVIEQTLEKAEEYADLAMISRTHGQIATPTTLGKEFANIAMRLKRTRDELAQITVMGKANGAVGNYNAHEVSCPEVNWPEFTQQFIESFGLEQNEMTTQVEPKDWIAKICNTFALFATQLENLDLNTWLHIKEGYFSIKTTGKSVGSSTMPHKINPIDFENSEGNLTWFTALAQMLATELPFSREQRDLTGSTIIRNIGSVFAHALIGCQSFVKGMKKLQANTKVITADIEKAYELLAEPVQQTMRRYGIKNAYEQLKAFSQGKVITKEQLHAFIDSTTLPDKEKQKLKQLTPQTYIGLAPQLTRKTIQRCRTDLKTAAKQPSVSTTQPGEVHVIAGLQWGDEGKGKRVDEESSSGKYDIVIRYNGGANAGHSIQLPNGQRFVTHVMPSGVFNKGVDNVIGNGVVLDPWQLLAEIKALQQKGIAITPKNLKISDRAHVVLPLHKEADEFLDKIYKIGTTKKGIGPTYASKISREGVRIIDLLNPAYLEKLIPALIKSTQATLKGLQQEYGIPASEFSLASDKKVKIPGEEAQFPEKALLPYDAMSLVQALTDIGKELKPFVTDTSHYLNKALKEGKNILVEGANGYHLDIDFGTYPYVTSSNASVNGVPTGTGLPPSSIKKVTGVVKAYTTRVGNGPHATELLDDKGEPNEIGISIRNKGNEFGSTTKRPRRCGWLDLMPVAYAMQRSGVTTLSLMLLDVLADQGELKVCYGYTLDGKELDFGSIPADLETFGRCKPLYKTFPGFMELKNCRSYADLPQGARDYLYFIEEKLGKPIEHISYGPQRNQTLVVNGGVCQAEQQLQKSAPNQLVKAMENAIDNLGSAWVANKNDKALQLSALLKQIRQNMRQDNLEEVKQDLIQFAHIASTSRGGPAHFFKKSYGETASAKALYKHLNASGALAILDLNEASLKSAVATYAQQNGNHQFQTVAISA